MPGVHVGVVPNQWDKWESQLVHFHDFERMPTEKGCRIRSQCFSCYDRQWRLELLPGGHEESDDGMVGLFLQNCSGTDFKAKFSLAIKDANGEVLKELNSNRYDTFDRRSNWGYDIIQHSFIIDPAKKFLHHGTLTVEVSIKPHRDHRCKNFIPENKFAQNMMDSFMDEDTADVVFEVKGSHKSDLVAHFHAHKVVLQFCAKGSTLASLCEDYNKSSPVPIIGIDPQIFRHMLYYVYGGKIEAAKWKDCSKDLIGAADKFGLSNLKVEAEAWYVKHLDLTVDTVIDNLVYADAKNCFLLKEEAMDFILKNGKEVLASKSFENMPESRGVTREIISVAMMQLRGDDKKEVGELESLSINELRTRLHYRGKDFDGSRKRLISQLKLDEERKDKRSKTSG
ncbi:hypothetical protein ACHAWF_002673 [Thalassiosira exigua]